MHPTPAHTEQSSDAIAKIEYPPAVAPGILADACSHQAAPRAMDAARVARGPPPAAGGWGGRRRRGGLGLRRRGRRGRRDDCGGRRDWNSQGLLAGRTINLRAAGIGVAQYLLSTKRAGEFKQALEKRVRQPGHALHRARGQRTAAPLLRGRATRCARSSRPGRGAARPPPGVIKQQADLLVEREGADVNVRRADQRHVVVNRQDAWRGENAARKDEFAHPPPEARRKRSAGPVA